MQAIVGAGLHYRNGELVGHRPADHRPHLSIEHAVEGNAWGGRNPGGKDEPVRAGADGFLRGKDLIDLVDYRFRQKGSRAAGRKTDSFPRSISRGLDLQQRLFCDLHLCSPRQVISSTISRSWSFFSSSPFRAWRALLAWLQ